MERSDCHGLVKMLDIIWRQCGTTVEGRSYCLDGRPKPMTEPLSPSLDNTPTYFDGPLEPKERTQRRLLLSQDSGMSSEYQQPQDRQPYTNIGDRLTDTLSRSRAALAPDSVDEFTSGATTPRASPDTDSEQVATEATPLLPRDYDPRERGHADEPTPQEAMSHEVMPGHASEQLEPRGQYYSPIQGSIWECLGGWPALWCSCWTP
jgi:hypothetical protein